jgi:hypothetical protein
MQIIVKQRCRQHPHTANLNLPLVLSRMFHNRELKQVTFLTTRTSRVHNLTANYGVSSLCLKSRAAVDAISRS